MHGYIDPFYESAEKDYSAGSIWTDQPVYLPPKHGLRITRVDPKDDQRLDYGVVGRTADTFNHPPVHSLKLASSEALTVTAAKWDRPVIIMGGEAAQEMRPSDPRARVADIVWAVPVYGADQYEEALRRRIQIYDLRNFFYLPEDKGLGFDEGFARLDHAQPIQRHLLRTHRGMRLSSDALDALIEWFIYFATGRLDPESLILDYRREQTAS